MLADALLKGRNKVLVLGTVDECVQWLLSANAFVAAQQRGNIADDGGYGNLLLPR